MLLTGDTYPYSLEITDAQVEAMRAYLVSLLGSLPRQTSGLSVAEYATRRVMPAGSPRPGPWSNEWTQYLVETMEFMSPASHIQRDICVKGAQGGWTAAAENILCYYMDEYPADILFMSGTQKMLERWATRRLETAIDTYGFRDKLLFTTGGDAEGKGGKNRRVGDKMFSKDYFGGRLDMASSRSASEMRATDKRILVRDEVDSAPAKLATGEGYWLDVSYARTNSWGALRKVFDFGTPTTLEGSETWKAYLLGDQRKFLVPCPRCGVFQPLEFGSEKSRHGLKPVRKAGQLVDAVYICDHCHDAMFEADKQEMVSAGYWEPTTTSTNRFWTSRHWPAYYSPVKTWEEIYFDYESAKSKPDGMRSFVNLIDGLPYKETGSKLSVTKLHSLKDDYHEGTIPEGVLFTTVALDVQQGSAKDENNPQRLELEVCGHGHGYRTWSILYKKFIGSVEDAYSGAWEDFYQFILEGGLRFPRRSGTLVAPKRIFLDSGWAPHAVYRFAERVTGAYATKGQGKDYKPDEADKKKHALLFKRGQGADGTPIIIISTNDYKRIMQAALRVQPTNHGAPPAGLCRFPREYGTPGTDSERYFEMLTAEERMADGSFESGGRRNEATDCRVGNLCAADSWLHDCVEDLKRKYREKGASEVELRRLTKDLFLTKLERQI